MQIANWMTRNPVCITRQDTLARAKELMDAGRFRRLPVIDNDKLVGIITERDLRQWHRQGFRLYWRWRSRSGRPSIDREVRDLIRQMNKANPLWGAPRIHGELLKLGIEVSQATVAKYMGRRVGTPSPTWRTFLRNEAIGIAAIDMFVAVSASFRLLYVMIVLAHSRREIVRFDVTGHPTAAWLAQQVIEAFPWETAPRFLLRDRDASYGSVFSKRVAAMGITGSSRHHAHRGRTLTSSE